MFMLKVVKQLMPEINIADITLDTAGQQRQAQAWSLILRLKIH